MLAWPSILRHGVAIVAPPAGGFRTDTTTGASGEPNRNLQAIRRQTTSGYPTDDPDNSTQACAFRHWWRAPFA
jgi:hypothetical protein